MPDLRPLTYPFTRCPSCGALTLLNITGCMGAHRVPGTAIRCPASGKDVQHG